MIAIYSYLSAPKEGVPPSYYISYVFDGGGTILMDEMVRSYGEVFANKTAGKVKNYIGPFEGLGEVGKYAFHLCQKMDRDGIGILSLEKYNAALECAHTTTELRQLLAEGADYIKNIDRQGKKGFISRFFN